VILTACERSPEVIAPVRELPPIHPQLAASDASTVETATYYSADVTLRFTGGQSPSYTGDGPQRTFNYLHEREMYSGVWETRATFASYLPLGPNGGSSPRPEIGRVETDDYGNYIRVYDRSGLLMMQRGIDSSSAKESYNQLTSGYVPPYNPPPGSDPGTGFYSVAPTTTGLFTAGSSASSSASSSTASSSPSPHPEPRGPVAANSRAWLDDIFVTPTSRGRVKTKIEKAFRKVKEAQPGGDKHDTYERTSKDGVLQQMLVDAATGAVNEVKLSKDGTVRQRIHYEYTEVQPGFLVRTKTRVEIVPPDPRATPFVLEQTLRNVRLTNGGTK
jgi:hypothetical protein